MSYTQKPFVLFGELSKTLYRFKVLKFSPSRGKWLGPLVHPADGAAAAAGRGHSS